MALRMSRPPDRWISTLRKWDDFSSPLRPHPDDTAVIERTAASLAAAGRRLTAVVLGVTPETMACAWPPDTRLHGFDRSETAIGTLWDPARAPAGATADVADWTALPLPSGSVDLVAADGSLNCVDWPDTAARVFAEVHRMLRPGGRFVVRSTLRLLRPEALDTILADLEAGQIRGPYALKVRIGTILHDQGLNGFSMFEMWKLWHRLFPDQEAVAARFGWPIGSFTMVDTYHQHDIRLVYPTGDELVAAVDPWFRVVETVTGSYELADRCPTFVLERR
jgi:SAM-dependent methyltransferase